MNGAQAAPAYVSIGFIYILNMFIRFLVGIGLRLFKIGNSMPRVFVAFWVMFRICWQKWRLLDI